MVSTNKYHKYYIMLLPKQVMKKFQLCNVSMCGLRSVGQWWCSLNVKLLKTGFLSGGFLSGVLFIYLECTSFCSAFGIRHKILGAFLSISRFHCFSSPNKRKGLIQWIRFAWLINHVSILLWKVNPTLYKADLWKTL